MPEAQQQWVHQEKLALVVVGPPRWVEVEPPRWVEVGPPHWMEVGPPRWVEVGPSQSVVVPLGQMTPQPRPAASSDRVLER